MKKLSIKDLDLNKNKILLRVDFNVPIDEHGLISDDTRIKATIPTIQYLLDRNCSIVLISHMGRPKKAYESKLSLKPCATRLQELLNHTVRFTKDCIGEEVRILKQNIQPKEIVMLENLRFHLEETAEEGRAEFAQKLVEHCDTFINDAFACCHREEASIVDVPKLMQPRAAMGLLVENEINYLVEHILQSDKSITAIIGGAKVSTKIEVLKSLLKKVDTLLIGGAMANTFLKAKNISLGSSLLESDFLEQANEIIELCSKNKVTIVLPKDLVFSDDMKQPLNVEVYDFQSTIPKNKIAVDIGPKTIQLFKQHLFKAQVVFWNGPLGVFEVEEFAQGTKEIAQILAPLEIVKIIGGGDSAAAIHKLGLESSFDHISTGGGASLELIEKGMLPGIEALSNKN